MKGKGPVRPIGSISVLAIVGALALAGRRSASTLAVDRGGTLRFDAAKGEANNVDLRDGGGQTTVTDSGSIIHAGNGCTQVTPHQASCPLPGGFGDQNVAMTLADRNDVASASKIRFGQHRRRRRRRQRHHRRLSPVRRQRRRRPRCGQFIGRRTISSSP